MPAKWLEEYGTYSYDSDYLKKKEKKVRKSRRSDNPNKIHYEQLTKFIDKYCAYDHGQTISSSDLYDIYIKFCNENGYKKTTLNNGAFTRFFKIVAVRDEYIKGIEFFYKTKVVKRTDLPTMRYPVTYWYNLILKGE